MNKIVFFILFLVFGALSAVAFTYFLGKAPVRFDSPVLTAFGVKKPEIVGFLPYWLMDRANKDYSRYITTLTYFGLALNGDGTVKKLNNPQEEEPGWTTLKGEKFNKLISDAKNHNLKQSLLVMSGDDEVIGSMMADPVTSANNLAAQVIPIMKEKGFTDLNLDLESFLDATESARSNFTVFVTHVTQQIREQKLGTVTLDLIPISLVKSKIYDPKALGAIVDRLVLMTYDYHYIGSFTTGAVAPIGGAGITVEYDVETAVKEALKVVPKEKILLGVPLYGYQWETISSSPESATIPGGSEVASVRRISDLITACATCSAQYNTVARAPYIVYPENDYFNQIYYENEKSMKEKIALARKYRLGGIALWALGYEDNTILNPLSSYKDAPDLPGLN